MASFQIATIYKDHATLRGYEKCGLAPKISRAKALEIFGLTENPGGGIA